MKIFELPNKLGALIKVTTDVQDEIQNLTMENRKMLSLSMANIISQNSNFPRISRATVDSIRHRLGFNYFLPIHTFLTTDSENKIGQFHIDT